MEPLYELEEGEAPYQACDDVDDTNIDPDVALSYIDERLQSVLGHFQKDFEGGVSAENLGAKFGGYGSFLPAHQRSPSISSQPKSPPRFHNHNMLVSPKHSVTEIPPQTSIALSSDTLSQKNGVTISGNVHSLHNLRGPLGDGSVRKESRLPSVHDAEKCISKDEPYLNKPPTSTDQRTLKVRIKVHPNKTGEKNTAIYCGLGLTSPSSMDSSPVESGEMPSEFQETCNESPASILKVMTSFPIAGGRLLSPLHDHLLTLSRSETNLGCAKLVATKKNGHTDSSISNDASTSSMGNVNDLTRKKVNYASQSGNYLEPKNKGKADNGGDMVSYLKKNSGSETFENKQFLSTDLNAKVLFDLGCDTGGSPKVTSFKSKSFRGSDEVIHMKKSGKMKDRLLHSKLVDDDHIGAEFENQNAKSISVEKIGEYQIRCSHRETKEHCLSKGDQVLAPVIAESDLAEGRKDSKGVLDHLEVNVKATSHQQDKLNIPDTKKKASEGKKKSVSSQCCAKSASGFAQKSAGSSAIIKNKKGSRKDVPKKTSGHKSKESKLDAHREPKASSDTSRLKSAHTKVDSQAIFGSVLKEPSTRGITPARECTPQTQEAPADPFLIEEDWVQCDRCEKWRLLPQGMKPDHLPQSWICSMLNWLPGMNSCDISEDETTAALNALYAPLHENPNNVQNHVAKTESVANLANVCHFGGSTQTANHMTNSGSKKHKVKKSENGESIVATTLTKNTHVEMTKGIYLANVNQPPGGSISNKFSDRDFTEQSEHVVMGDEKSRKKIKRDPILSDYTDVKKTKAVNDIASSKDLIMEDLPTKAHVKYIKKHQNHVPLKETKSNIGGGLRVSVKTLDHVQDSLDNGSFDIKACNEREISTKKRKFENKDCLETLQNDVGHLGVSKVSIKDESSNGGFKKHKKCKVSHTEANESSTSKSEQKSKANGVVTKIILPKSRNSPVSRIMKDQQVKKCKVKMKPQLTLDDIDSLRKDLGYEELSTTATSSTSKVSDPRKRRSNDKVKGSPVESVSSSPMRTCNLNSLSSTRKHILEKDDGKYNDITLLGSPKKYMGCNTNFVSNGSGQSRKRNHIIHAKVIDSSVVHLPDINAREKFNTDVKLSPGVGNAHLGMSDAVLSGECMHAANSNDRKDRMKNLLHKQKAGKNLTVRSKEKNKDLGFGSQKNGEKLSDRPVDNLGLKPFQSLKEETDGTHNRLEYDTKLLGNSKNVDNLVTAKPTGLRRDNQLNGSNAKLNASCNMDVKAPTQQKPNPELEAETILRERSSQMSLREEKAGVDLSAGDKQATSTGASRPPLLHKVSPVDPQTKDSCVAGISSKMSKVTGPVVCHNGTQNSTGHLIPVHSANRNMNAPNCSERDASNQSASSVLREAEELRDYADRLKSTGFNFEYNEAYFQAALKFLYGASLLEICSGDSNKYRETNQIQIYTNTAKLCETCANEYQKRQEMATAALAYKCMEIAYMRVVYCKNMSASRVWPDMQASLQMPMPPQGESPSSSASDVDNTNNQAMTDKTALSKVMNGSHHETHVIAPSNRPSFVRLLDFAKDVNAAMEASRRAQNAFAAANIILEEAQNMEAISSVKRVIDFSFQDVEELTRLVRLAIEAINRQSIGGNR
ncbi:unnamed protein product [Cuscuta campestris]|uniref:CW-type domain-containing protein n=1 Tax=Cuscuta campestris TaxID=132261 RepID=A0A484LSN4_9ASTE|nr:unnamed protein product [Cuscuta campestris]